MRSAGSALQGLATGASVAHILGRDVSPRAKDENGWTDLHYAAAADLYNVARHLIAAGADVNARLRDDGAIITDSLVNVLNNLTDLNWLWTWRFAQTPLHIAAEQNADKTAALLLKNGADVEVQDTNGNTPLHIAAQRNADKIAALLLKNGADVDVKGDGGRTPLHYAARGNADKTAALLLKNGETDMCEMNSATRRSISRSSTTATKSSAFSKTNLRYLPSARIAIDIVHRLSILPQPHTRRIPLVRPPA